MNFPQFPQPLLLSLRYYIYVYWSIGLSRASADLIRKTVTRSFDGQPTTQWQKRTFVSAFISAISALGAFLIRGRGKSCFAIVKLTFVSVLWSWVPKRLRELLFCLRSKVQNQADAVLHKRFHQNAERPRRKAFDLLTLEGAIKKVMKVLGEVWRTFFQEGSPRKNFFQKSFSPTPHQTNFRDHFGWWYQSGSGSYSTVCVLKFKVN